MPGVVLCFTVQCQAILTVNHPLYHSCSRGDTGVEYNSIIKLEKPPYFVLYQEPQKQKYTTNSLKKEKLSCT